MKSEKQRLHLEKLAKSRIGKTSSLKGKKRKPFTKEWKENMKKAQKKYFEIHDVWNKGKKFSDNNWGRKKGFKMSEEQKIKISEGGKRMWDRRGRKPENKRNRQQDMKYRKWREEVFKRDNWICQLCSKRGGNLEAHHKKRWAKYPKLRYVVSNGITLCIPCHKKLDKFRR